MTRFADLLRSLAGGGVEFIVIGGIAAAAHGSPRGTQDVDVVYSRTDANLRKLVWALEPLRPYLRGAPEGLPFRLDFETLKAGLNFTLTTTAGWLDLLAEIPGGGPYPELVRHSLEIEVFGVSCRVLDVDKLIETKRAAGRPKDFEAVAELNLLRDRLRAGRHK